MNINMDNYYSARKNVFERIEDASTATKLLMSLMMACFTGIMAQIIIPLPWTPVPITAQTFAVLCSGKPNIICYFRYCIYSMVWWNDRWY